MALRVDPALVPFLDTLAEMLASALMKDQGAAQSEAARPPADIVKLHPRTTPRRTSRRRSTARR